MALRATLPRRYWIGYNDLLVSFGQNVCAPISPSCSTCPVSALCPRVGVRPPADAAQPPQHRQVAQIGWGSGSFGVSSTFGTVANRGSFSRQPERPAARDGPGRCARGDRDPSPAGLRVVEVERQHARRSRPSARTRPSRRGSRRPCGCRSRRRTGGRCPDTRRRAARGRSRVEQRAQLAERAAHGAAAARRVLQRDAHAIAARPAQHLAAPPLATRSSPASTPVPRCEPGWIATQASPSASARSSSSVKKLTARPHATAIGAGEVDQVARVSEDGGNAGGPPRRAEGREPRRPPAAAPPTAAGS